MLRHKIRYKTLQLLL